MPMTEEELQANINKYNIYKTKFVRQRIYLDGNIREIIENLQDACVEQEIPQEEASIEIDAYEDDEYNIYLCGSKPKTIQELESEISLKIEGEKKDREYQIYNVQAMFRKDPTIIQEALSSIRVE